MKLRSNSFSVYVIVFCACVTSAAAQQYKLAPLAVKKSAFMDEVRTLVAGNPKLTPPQLAEAASVILEKHGIGFGMYFDAGSCERIKKVKEQLKDPTQSLALGATLESVDAEGASLLLPEPVFAPGACGCYVELPLLQITDRDFTTILSGRNIRFHLPSNFYTDQAVLLDAKDKTTVKRKWRIPFRGTPIGVSHDENVLYLAFNEPELANLSLLIFSEGVFQIGTRAEAEEGGKGQRIGPPRATPTEQVEFVRWGKIFTVNFPASCATG